MKRTVTLPVLVAGFLLSTGCASFGPECDTFTPERVSGGWSHTSHPLLGYPFGPADEEDTLDTADVQGTWRCGRVEVDVGLGYRLRDGGFYGDDFIYYSRVGVDLWTREPR